MKAVFGLVLVTGLGLAGTAVYMVRDHFEAQAMQLAQTRAVAAAAVPTVEVYAVTRAVGYGERLRPEDVRLVHYAEPFLPEGVFRAEAELFPKGPDDLRTVLRPMEPNEPVLAVKVTAPGEDAGITSRLATGMRAFTISVDAITGVSGFLRPGDRVDVYWSGRIEEGGLAAREVSQLIEANLSIIGVDQTDDDTQRQVGVARTVTVEVSPEQVAKLALAQRTGALYLALVGYGDDTVSASIEMDQKILLDLEDAPVPVAAPVAAAPRVCTVRTRRGAEVIETPVDCPDDGISSPSGLTSIMPPAPEPAPELALEPAPSPEEDASAAEVTAATGEAAEPAPADGASSSSR